MIESMSKRTWYIIWILLALLSSFAAVSTLIVPWRTKIQNAFFGEKRQLLATVTGHLGENEYLILKFQTNKGIIVEVQQPENDSYKLIDRIFIPDPYDGYVMMNSQATRLALTDIDDDQQLEIIAPTFDSNLAAHLNALRLDPESMRLKLVQEHAE